MNLKELKEKVDAAIELLGEVKPEDIQVQATVLVDAEIIINTSAGNEHKTKVTEFEFCDMEIEDTDFNGECFTLTVKEE